MATVQDALNATKTILSGISVQNGPGSRIWTLPQSSGVVADDVYPFIVVSKVNSQVGSWGSFSYGVGWHKWTMLIAVYLASGPVVVSTPEANATLLLANEWYPAMSNLLFANITLNGTADYIGDGEGTLFEYVTDNIMWNAKQHYGHLFLVPVAQTVNQAVTN